jgi:hypothetical protein
LVALLATAESQKAAQFETGMMFYFVKLVLMLGAMAALLWGGYRYNPWRGS